MAVDSFLVGILACPHDGSKLSADADTLTCACGRTYPVIDGIPVMLRDDVMQTHGEAQRSLAAARGERPLDEVIEATPGETPDTVPAGSAVDPHVQSWISATGGVMYKDLIGRLKDYPIPHLDLPHSPGKLFLDIGCNWGRWCVAAARLGFIPVGIDPSLQALRAAQRVARQLGVRAHFVCGDGRYLPFQTRTFDVVYSYSVLQHFAKADVAQSLREVARVVRPSGEVVIQMPNVFGLRSLYHQARRGFHEGRDFDVRYWTPGELRHRFEELIGPTRLDVDGFFSLNPQAADKHLLPLRYRAVVTVSDTLRAASRAVGALRYAADSLMVRARPRATS
ncbi:MAG TPA: methyltransferase domain-containing protein [Gemmatimonadaceae bacterium]